MDALSAKHAGEPAWTVIQRAQADIGDFDPSKLDPARQEAFKRAMAMSKSQGERVAAGQSIDPTRNFQPADQFVGQGDDIVSAATTGAQRAVEESSYPQVVKDYARQFTVPFKLNGPRGLDILNTSRKMVEYGVGDNFDDIVRAGNMTTGKSGIIAEVNRRAVKDIVGSVTGADDAINAAKNVLDDAAYVDDKVSEKVMGIITKRLKGKTDAASVFDAVQELEKLGYNSYGKSTKMSPNILAEDIGDAFLEASRTMAGKLDDMGRTQNVLAKYKTPEIINALRGVGNGTLADDFAKAATFPETRALQSDFVKALKAVELTNQQGASVGSKLAQSFQGSAMAPVNEAFIKPAARTIGRTTSKAIDVATNLAKGVGTGIPPVVNAGLGVAEGLAQPLANPLLQRAVTQTAIQSALPQNRPVQEVQPLPQEELLPEGLNFEQPQVQGISTQQPAGLNIDPNQLLIAMLEDPQNREVYQAIYDRITKGGAKPLNARQQILQKNAQSGLDALDVMEGKLADPNLVLQTQGLPFISDNEYNAAERRVKDALRIVGGVEQGQGFALGPLRVGGERSYEDYLPKIDDSPEDRVAKFELVRALLADFAYGQQPATEEVDTGGLVFSQ